MKLAAVVDGIAVAVAATNAVDFAAESAIVDALDTDDCLTVAASVNLNRIHCEYRSYLGHRTVHFEIRLCSIHRYLTNSIHRQSHFLQELVYHN